MTLESAIIAYWHEYGYWPITYYDRDEYDDFKRGRVYLFTTTNNTNQRVFYNLKREATAGAKDPARSPPLEPGNPLSYVFLDESDERIRLLTRDRPLFDASGRQYKVAINFKTGTVNVGFE